MKITSNPILLVEDDQVDFMRPINAYWTISEVPL
jgi:hypothetical protein